MKKPLRTVRPSMPAALVVCAMVLGMLGVATTVQGSPAEAALAPTSTDQSIPPGAYIIDMGGVPTEKTQLLPYGMIQDLLVNQRTPVTWLIKDGKTVDTAIDFSATTAAGTKQYRTGAFIIRPEYAPFVQATITSWKGKGVTIDGPTTAAFNAPVYGEVTSWPRTALDGKNGQIAAAFYTAAGIGFNTEGVGPGDAGYDPFKPYWKDPSKLNDCDDLYVMPHADPTVATHKALKPFNASGGYIWAGCHAVSVLENMSGTDAGTNYPLGSFSFLSTNGLVPFGSHGNGSVPYTTSASRSDPIQQYQGSIDAATQNGSEQIYLPSLQSSWRPSTNILVSDPTQADVPSKSAGPPAVMAYGRGFGNPSNGMVMYEGGHDLRKAGGAPSLAAQRAFFNFSLMSGIDRSPAITASVTPGTIAATRPVQLSSTTTGGKAPYTWEWTSSCAGTFDNPTVENPKFTPANVTATTNCLLRVRVVDGCGRFAVAAVPLTVTPPAADLRVSKSVDPSSTTPVIAGQELTYSLNFDNTSGTAAATVDHVDHLGAVIDDAQFVSGSLSAPAGLTAARNGPGTQIAVTGSVPAGQRLTVTFRVKVSADGARGDSELVNFVVAKGQTPPATCAPDNTSCTQNPVKSWTASKTATPATASQVNPGDTITYHVTAASLKGEISGVVLTDDLSAALSHATFVPGSATLSIDGGAPAAVANPAGTTLTTAAFTVPATKSAELSYQVIVNDDAWSQRLVNSVSGAAVHLANPAESSSAVPFPPGSCTSSAPCTTEHLVRGRVFWTKTDPGREALSGSEWQLAGPSGAGSAQVAVVDCIASSAAECTGPDQDNRAGHFEVGHLAWGNYTLTETKAPTGYVLNSTPHMFTVGIAGGAASGVDLGDIVNQPQAALVIPLTGGLGADAFLLGGVLLLALLLAFALTRARRARSLARAVSPALPSSTQS
ncbi:SpaA isopeptide-forming pilin-related protein [Arthrobacter sp. KNU40]|uniref:DUF7927 domain-containing protein n=1 Tax=Arthrobacter sp. KNU40 TaxID=3447965 RepID=UPI003F5FE93D